jgi:hypothetical protein
VIWFLIVPSTQYSAAELNVTYKLTGLQATQRAPCLPLLVSWACSLGRLPFQQSMQVRFLPMHCLHSYSVTFSMFALNSASIRKCYQETSHQKMNGCARVLDMFFFGMQQFSATIPRHSNDVCCYKVAKWHVLNNMCDLYIKRESLRQRDHSIQTLPFIPLLTLTWQQHGGNNQYISYIYINFPI